VFALNRHTTDETQLEVELRGFPGPTLTDAFELKHADLKATNTKDAPDNVAPLRHGNCNIRQGNLSATLKPLSWNVFVLAGGA